MQRRKIANEAEARKALSAVARSGAGIGAWARAHGIDGRSLHAWDMAFARRGTRMKRKALVELVAASAAVSSARYAIRVGGFSFEFSDDAREETLRRVLAVLRAC